MKLMMRFLRSRTTGGSEAAEKLDADHGLTALPLPAMKPDWYGNAVAIAGYGLLCLQVIFFIALALTEPYAYRVISRESGAVEILTAVWYGCGGVLLLVVAMRKKVMLTRGIYALGAILMIFIAGEEINYGQFFLKFPTPDFLADINNQDHFNVHNIYGDHRNLTAPIFRNCRLVLCIVAIVALFLGKERLLGIPLPSMPLILGIIVAESYVHFSNWINTGDFLFESTNILLVIIAVYAISTKQVKALPTCLSVIAIVIATAYAMTFIRIGSIPGYKHLEFQEYLYAFAALWYAIELWLGQRRLSTFSAVPIKGLRTAAAISRRWSGPAVCVLAIFASVGLALFVYFGIERNDSYFERLYYQAVDGLEPIERAAFDIYIKNDNLYYIKEGCTDDDIAETFFLHIYPVQAADLSAVQQEYGFANLDFDFDERGVVVDEKCAAVIALPQYPITLIRTGQYIQNGGRLWEVEFEPLVSPWAS